MYYFFLILSVVFIVISQLLLKSSVEKVNFKDGIMPFLKSLLKIKILISIVLILFVPFLYIIALKKINLSTAYIFTGLNYPLIIIGAKIFLKEKINQYQIIGIILIFFGFLIFYR